MSDQPTVEQARIALLDYHVKRGLLFPGMDERNHELHRLLDAYAAAARAEGKSEAEAEIAQLQSAIERWKQEEDDWKADERVYTEEIATLKAEIARLRAVALQAPAPTHSWWLAMCHALGESGHLPVAAWPEVIARLRLHTCATCRHYSGESCTRPFDGDFPMAHRICPPTFGCNQWEKMEP